MFRFVNSFLEGATMNSANTLQSILIVLALVSGGAAKAQQASPQLICDQAVPPMLEMISNMAGIPDVFDQVMSQLSAPDQLRFAEVVSAGRAMEEAAIAYRTAFLQACFG